MGATLGRRGQIGLGEIACSYTRVSHSRESVQFGDEVTMKHAVTVCLVVLFAGGAYGLSPATPDVNSRIKCDCRPFIHNYLRLSYIAICD